jgi:hypothetical protein
LEVAHDLGNPSFQVLPSAVGSASESSYCAPTLEGGESGTHVASRSSRFGTGGIVAVRVATDMMRGGKMVAWRGDEIRIIGSEEV